MAGAIPEVLHGLGDGVPEKPHGYAASWLTRDAHIEEHPVGHLR